jgi:hypothetical protein
MKTLSNTYRALFTLTMLTILAGCSGDDASPKTSLLKKLSDSWQVTSVTLNNVEVDGYDAFSVTLAKSGVASVYSFVTSGRPEISPWPADGNWSFGDNAKTQLVRDPGTVDELAISYAVTDTELRLEFTYTGDGYGARTASTTGQWIFIFSRSEL